MERPGMQRQQSTGGGLVNEERQRMRFCEIRLNATLAGEAITLGEDAAACESAPFDFNFDTVRNQRAELLTQETAIASDKAELERECSRLLEEVREMDAVRAVADMAEKKEAEDRAAARKKEAEDRAAAAAAAEVAARAEAAAAREEAAAEQRRLAVERQREEQRAEAAAKLAAVRAKQDRLRALESGPQNSETIAEQLRLHEMGFSEAQISESLKRANRLDACINWILSNPS
jgi:hypothetical protein